MLASSGPERTNSSSTSGDQGLRALAGINERIEALKPLSPLERAFKHLHTSGIPLARVEALSPQLVEIFRGHPAEEARFWRIKNREETEALDEPLFFDGNADIFLMLHPRYMPEPTHTHDFFELQYLLSGSLSQNIGEGKLEMGAGDVCFMVPGTQHTPLVHDDETLLVNILIRQGTFRSTFMDLLRANDVISDFFTRVLYCTSFYPFMYCKGCGESELASVILEMIKVNGQEMRYKDRLLRALLEEFFIYLLRDHEYDFVTASKRGRDHRNIVAILSYIHQNFRTVTLSEVAGEFSYNDAHLSRMIRTYTGSGFSQVLKTIKLQHAANLLEGSVMPVSEVITDSGYEDKTYFYREFKKKFGVTPAEYRKNAKETLGRQ